jgi:GTP1/Obg family GTP-binding protein
MLFIVILCVWWVLYINHNVYIVNKIRLYEEFAAHLRNLRMMHYSYDGYMDVIQKQRQYKEEMARLEVELMTLKTLRKICGKYYYSIKDIPEGIDFRCERP